MNECTYLEKYLNMIVGMNLKTILIKNLNSNIKFSKIRLI